jgi:hypothetical protein
VVTQVDRSPRVSMIRYAAIFVVADFCSWFLVDTLMRVAGMPRIPFRGRLIVLGAACLVSYVFVRGRRRIFSPDEKWRLVCYCSGYLVLFSLYAKILARSKMVPGSVEASLNISTSFAMAAFVCLVDILLLVLFFQFGAPRMMRSYLKGRSESRV